RSRPLLPVANGRYQVTQSGIGLLTQGLLSPWMDRHPRDVRQCLNSWLPKSHLMSDLRLRLRHIEYALERACRFVAPSSAENVVGHAVLWTKSALFEPEMRTSGRCGLKRPRHHGVDRPAAP